VAKISKMPVNEIHLKLLEIQEAFLMLGSTSPAKNIRVNIRVGKIMMQPISNGKRKLSFGQNPTSFQKLDSKHDQFQSFSTNTTPRNSI